MMHTAQAGAGTAGLFALTRERAIGSRRRTAPQVQRERLA